MINALIKLFTGDPNRKILEKYQPIVEQINSFENSISKLSDEELQNKTTEFKQKIADKLNNLKFEKLIKDDVAKRPGQIRTTHDQALMEVLNDILPEAFAVCREASKRVLNMRHFDVQLIGGLQLHNGGIAEMQTGEGKTLVCTLPAYLNALAGKGVHVITVNDYLAQRDSQWMGKLYNFLGLSVGLIVAGKSNKARKEAYACDITYGTNNEFGFDYLRDNMETSINDCVQRPYYMAIVDEVDSILIDEARTPLIISGMPDSRKNDIYLAMNKVAFKLKKGLNDKDTQADYYVDEKARNVILTDNGIKEAEGILKVKDLWDPEMNFAHHLLQALKAKELFTKDTDYIVKINEENNKKEVVIVDEFTGRLMEGRRWSDGLHQAVEAKEGVPIQEETLTMASITFQNLFRLYPKLSGMTGTAMTEAEEFEKIYNLYVLQIPTNRENIRKDVNDVVYKNEFAKFFAIIEEIVKANKQSTPVLVGTTSIEKSEAIAAILSKPFAALKMLELRVKRLEKTFDLKNFKSSKILERPANIKYEDALQLKDEICASKSKLSEDELFAIDSFVNNIEVLEAIRKGLKFSVLNAKHHQKEAEIIREAGKPGGITIATNMAGRGTDIILGGHLSSDPNDPKHDVVDLEAQSLVKEMGGLYVIGSERHESRRIDNQLRGRCARQGDPGKSKFFLSLEDNLMRIFGGEQVINIMNLLKADEDLPIEASIISGAINNSQKKVESHNFDIRKHVLQYDDVINTQREVIYRERREILEGGDIHSNILEMIDEHIEKVVYSYINPNLPLELWFDNSEGISRIQNVFETIKATLGHGVYDKLAPMDDFRSSNFDALLGQIKKAALDFYQEREQDLGIEVLREAERQIMLHVLDSKWINHIHAMDSLKDGIHLQGYGQKDPLIEYKKESFDMFENLLAEIRENTVILMFHSQIVKKETQATVQS
ncbi:MAG: preprotein translocase subunit SecA [Candidatus Caenarcaniphilales bacterium]|nr:preprotein translocase subunit SecA [Candidatus Caenarcaniphilales bacterium]